MTFRPGESGNPAGRPPRQKPTAAALEQASRATERFDGWTNFATALGTTRDKRTLSWFSPDIVTDIEALNLWRGDDICRRVIESGPKAAYRRGITLKVQDKELAEAVKRDMEELGLIPKFIRARQFERAYGGAALYPVTDDVGDLADPIADGAVNEISAIHLLEPRELMPASWDTDIRSKTWMQPLTWRLMPMNGGGGGMGMTNQIIHTNRLIVFPGRRISRSIAAYQRPGWGDSELSGIYPIIRDFGATWGHVAALLQDFAQGVLSMEGYASLMKEADGEAIVKRRLQMLDAMRSTMRMMVMDKGDTFSRQQTPMGGLSDLLHDFALRIAAAAEQPVTVLFGMAPAGLNATGENDIRGWYDTISADRELYDKPRLDHFLRMYFKSKDGATKGQEPKSWSLEFPPLWEPTEKERADTRLAIAQADQIYAINIGACTPEDVAESRWKGDTYSAEMTIDWARREKQQKAEEAMAAEQHDIEVARAAAGAAASQQPPVAPQDPSPVDGGGAAVPVPETARRAG